MKKRDILKMESIAYYSGLNGLEIKKIEYGITDYLYCVSGYWYGGESSRLPHRLKIYTDNSGRAYVRLHGCRIPLDECIKMEGGL